MVQIHELNNAGPPAPGTYFATDNGSDTGKADFNEIGHAFFETYQGTQLSGQFQTLKQAIDNALSKNAYDPTGAIAQAGGIAAYIDSLDGEEVSF